MKFVETPPGATLAKSTQYLAECLAVHTVTAVRHHTQQAEGFG